MINKPYFSQIETYFQNEIVAKTSQIKQFVPNSDRAFINFLSDAEYPALVLTDYEATLDGNDQRTLGSRTLTFTILIDADADDNLAQRQAKDLAESIGLNIIAKIDYDDKCGEISWLKNTFQKQSTRFNDVEFEDYRNLFGIEFHIEFKFKNSLKYNIDFWK